jgi:hypothetical protein
MFSHNRKLLIAGLVAMLSFFTCIGVGHVASSSPDSKPISVGQSDMFSKEMQADPVPKIFDGIKKQFTNTNPLSFDNLVSWTAFFFVFGVGILVLIAYHEKFSKRQDK